MRHESVQADIRSVRCHYISASLSDLSIFSGRPNKLTNCHSNKSLSTDKRIYFPFMVICREDSACNCLITWNDPYWIWRPKCRALNSFAPMSPHNSTKWNFQMTSRATTARSDCCDKRTNGRMAIDFGLALTLISNRGRASANRVPERENSLPADASARSDSTAVDVNIRTSARSIATAVLKENASTWR